MAGISDGQLQQYVDQVFLRYDRDGSGILEANELTGFFNDLFQMMNHPMRITNVQALQALKAIDINNDGRANKMELFIALRQLLNKNAANSSGSYQNQYQNQNYNNPYQNQGNTWGSQNQGSWGNQGQQQSWGSNQNQGWGGTQVQTNTWGSLPNQGGSNWGSLNQYNNQNQGWGNTGSNQNSWPQKW